MANIVILSEMPGSEESGSRGLDSFPSQAGCFACRYGMAAKIKFYRLLVRYKWSH
jgi:hypothetical protein